MCWNLGKLEYRIIDIIQLESFLLILKTATEKYIYILCKVSQKVILSLLENSNILHWSKNTETNLEISVSSNFGCAIKKKNLFTCCEKHWGQGSFHEKIFSRKPFPSLSPMRSSPLSLNTLYTLYSSILMFFCNHWCFISLSRTWATKG